MGLLDIFKKPTPPNLELLVKDLVVRPDKKDEIKFILKQIRDNFSSYYAVERATGVPAILVAAIHYREASFSFKTVLHNGELLTDVNKFGTRLEPKGLGKGLNWTWVQAAIHALTLKKAMFPEKWTEVAMVEFAERYNGLGYRKKGMISPYCFAGAECYTGGLYVADGKLDLNKFDQRIGVAPILKMWRLTTV